MNYVKELVLRYQDIREIWLFGSRANNTSTELSDWDLMVMANKEVLESLIISPHDPECVDLLVVYDGNNFSGPWPRQSDGALKRGSLIDWEWHQIGPEEAEYKATKPVPGSNFHVNVTTLRATRIYPKQLRDDA